MISVMIKVTLLNKHLCLLHNIQMSTDPSGITFVDVFCEKYLPAVDKWVLPGHPHNLSARETPDEKLKIVYVMYRAFQEGTHAPCS